MKAASRADSTSPSLNQQQQARGHPRQPSGTTPDDCTSCHMACHAPRRSSGLQWSVATGSARRSTARMFADSCGSSCRDEVLPGRRVFGGGA